MELEYVHVFTIIVVFLFVSISVFQVLLSLGYPLGEFAMGGYYKVLPKGFRVLSAINSLILLLMGLVLLQHTSMVTAFVFLPTSVLVWVITVFLCLNSLANLMSRSKKERIVMTPLSSIAFILCLFITLS